MTKKIIFHLPIKINPEIKSASHIRPLKMLKAFESLCLEVFTIMGDLEQRKKKFKQLTQRVDDGEKFEGVYSESSTMPNALTESHHLPLEPFFEKKFFQYCSEQKIPIGLFYRDIHWNFSHYAKINPVKKMLARFFYFYDLKVYRKFVDVLFLPSVPMLKHIPIELTEKTKVTDLPSGVELVESKRSEKNRECLKLIYVGGTGELYQNQKLFKTMEKLNKQQVPVELHYCTREIEWNQSKDLYPEVSNVIVHHLSGPELAKLYREMDFGIIFVRPSEYWNFVMPMKAFDYLSYDLPIISHDQLFIGQYVQDHQLGVNLKFKNDSLAEFILKVSEHPELLCELQQKVMQNKQKHTWEERAKKVLNYLEIDIVNK